MGAVGKIRRWANLKSNNKDLKNAAYKDWSFINIKKISFKALKALPKL